MYKIYLCHNYYYYYCIQAKKAREQAALKNAQILFEEIDAEKEKKELRKKAAQRKKAKRKERKRKGQEREKVAEVLIQCIQ